MTAVAANGFKDSNGSTGIREPGSQQNAEYNTHSTQLPRTANLTNWKSESADVQLLPSSCINNYLDLVIRNNPIQLIPSNPSTAEQLVTVEPMNSSSLLTRHREGKLRLRCRNLEAETAPTAKPIPYNLYFAAGFVVYKRSGETETRRVPILLIPVTINRLRGRGSNYSIQYRSGARLQVNPHVAELCSTYVDPQVKPFTTTTDLREYLRAFKTKVHQNINCKISANSGIISLRTDVLSQATTADIVDINLARTKPGIKFQPLPATPTAFDPQLAIRILRFIPTNDLPKTLQSYISGSADQSIDHSTAKPVPVTDAEPQLLDDATLDKYYKCAGWLVDIGLGHWKLKDIAKLTGRVRAMTDSLNNLLSNPQYKKYFRDEFRTIDMLYRLNRTADKILNSPPEMQHHAISQHANVNIKLMLQQAKIQASSLEQELEEFDDIFHMAAVPSSSALRRLIKNISQREDEPQLNNPNYFKSRNTLNEILQHPNGVVTDNDLDLLERLAKTLEFADQYSVDSYYKRHFGSLFKGTDTNWQRLDSVISYVHSLSQDLGTSRLVAQFADEWVSFKRDFGDIAPDLAGAASAAHKLCSLIPLVIDQDTSLDHAIISAYKFKVRIDKWQKYLHKNFADTELTPFQLLSNVDLSEHNYPKVTLSQQEIDERIYRHIIGSGLTPAEVSATSEWLQNVIVRLQTDTPTVRRYLDKEVELLTNLA